MGLGLCGLRINGVGYKAIIKKRREPALIKQYEAEMKQYLIEAAFYLLINGLILNIYLVKKLMQKISDFVDINKRLREKIDTLDNILSSKQD